MWSTRFGRDRGGQGGVYHVSGAADVSYAAVAKLFAQRVGAANDLVEPVHGIDSGMPYEELTPFTSLATGRLSRLNGFVPPERLRFCKAYTGLRSQPPEFRWRRT